MRKILMVLAVLLLAAPAWAAVNVNCTAVDPCNTYEVRVSYSADTNDIRAFGIRIDVNNGATISINEVNDVNDKDYYIFPGSIDINDTTGDVDDYGSAVAEGGNGQSYMILEMGSLYAASDPCHTTDPPSSGTLCTFDVSKECTVSLSRDTDRGGVVMEDGSDYASLSGCIVNYADCMPQAHPDWAQYDSVDRPDGWCTANIPRQCHGDADNRSQGKGNYWTSTWDLDVLIGAWNKDYPTIAGQTVTTGGGDDIPLINADFDHLPQGKGNYRVSTWDLNILVANWGIAGKPDPNCP